MVVCPIYQLPNKTSQIYQQATSRNVCIFTYSHLSLLLTYSEVVGKQKARELLRNIFKIVPALHPSKSAYDYWLTVNMTMLAFSEKIERLWNTEKEASEESVTIAKEEGLRFLSEEREKIMRMSHHEALRELIKVHKIDSRMKTIESIFDNGLFTVK